MTLVLFYLDDFGDFVSAQIQNRKWTLRKTFCSLHYQVVTDGDAVTPPKLEGPRCGGAVTLPEISTTLRWQKSVTSLDRSGSQGGRFNGRKVARY